jgi:hypothetical protein
MSLLEALKDTFTGISQDPKAFAQDVVQSTKDTASSINKGAKSILNPIVATGLDVGEAVPRTALSVMGKEQPVVAPTTLPGVIGKWLGPLQSYSSKVAQGQKEGKTAFDAAKGPVIDFALNEPVGLAAKPVFLAGGFALRQGIEHGSPLIKEAANRIGWTKSVSKIKEYLGGVFDASPKELTDISTKLKNVTDPNEVESVLNAVTSAPKSAYDEAVQVSNALPEKKSIATKLKDIPSKLKTSLIAEFTPAKELEEKIFKEYGMKKEGLTLDRSFEQLAGAGGKAKADLHTFDTNVTDLIKDNRPDFNAYLFLRRTGDRLATDPESRAVASWTEDKVAQGIEQLKASVGEETFKKFEDAAAAYQIEMDKALRLQVESGRMTEKLYNEIKAENDFYAPFKVMEHIDANYVPGKNPIETMQDLTGKIRGIKDEDFSLQDIMQSSREQIVKSRILADKNEKMNLLNDLKNMDVDEKFIKEVSPTAVKAKQKGYDIVKYFVNGKEKAIEVPEALAVALKGGNTMESGLIGNTLRATALPFKLGATGANATFQAVNMFFADAPRLAIMSKYGIKSPEDAVRFPLDFARGMFSSIKGNFGRGDELYEKYLKSGASNSTIQKAITPEAFADELTYKARSIPGKVYDTVSRLTSAVEETTKLAGFNRALRLEGIDKLPKAEAEKKLAEIVTEIRNFAGSPDFSRSGADIRPLNLILMFLNARIQGTAADLSRLAGADGAKNAGAAWARLSAAVGVPAVALHVLNNSEEYKKDYDMIPQKEKEDYFMIPKPTYFTDESTGQKVRDYYRIPKREMIKLFSNTIENAVDFARDQDPESIKKLASGLFHGISPVNLSGKDMGDRMLSLASGLNPIIKVPGEYATGKNFYFGDDTVPKSLQNNSAELQYKENTPEVFKSLGKLLGASPLKLEQAISGITGGGLNQFAMGKPVEGRSKITEYPIFKRFNRSTRVNQEKEINDIIDVTIQQSDERLLLSRKAEEKHKEFSKIAETNREEATSKLRELKKADPDLYDKIVEIKKQEKFGVTYPERLISYLGVENGVRAVYIHKKISELKTDEEKKAYFKNLRDKKIISDEVNKQLKKLKKAS